MTCPWSSGAKPQFEERSGDLLKKKKSWRIGVPDSLQARVSNIGEQSIDVTTGTDSSNPGPTDILDWIILSRGGEEGGGCHMQCKMFSIGPDFSLLDAISIPSPSCDNLKCLRSSPGVPVQGG